MMKRQFNIPLWMAFLFILSGNCLAALDEAATALQNEDFATAIQYLEKAPKLERDNPQWQLLRAAAEAGKGDLKGAEKRYLALIEQAPQQPEAYNNLAALYARQGKLDEAIALLEQAMKTSESYATVYANLSSIYYEKSRNAYARALQMEQRKDGPSLRPILVLASALAAEQPAEPEASPQQAAATSPVESGQAAESPAKPVVEESTQPPEAVNVALVEVEGVVASPLPAPAEDGLRRDEIIAMLNDWAADWMGQRVDAYLAAYASEFQPGQGLDRQQWQMQRRRRLSRPESIEVHLGDFEVQFIGDDRASVTLVQYYRSERYSDTVRKRFQLIRAADGWKIVTEKTIEAL